VRRHRGESGEAEHQHGHQCGDPERRLDRRTTGVVG
jgi:hypothetical protein